MTDKIDISLETTTPLFLGGAYSRPDISHSGDPELHPPTFRGALRYWLRQAGDASPTTAERRETVAALNAVRDRSPWEARLRFSVSPSDNVNGGADSAFNIIDGRPEVGMLNGDAQALMVPEQALMQDGDVRFVYTVVDGKAKKTTVKTGTRTPGLVQVVEGLKAGDVVITAGQAKPMMHDGMPVMSLPPQGAGGDKPAAVAPKTPAAAGQPAKADTDKPANGG